MSGITYVRGDATVPLGKGVKVIAHVCNDSGGWGKGFVLALSRRWPQPEASYRAWHRDRAAGDFGLGAAQFVQVGPYTWVANLIGQRGTRTGSKGVPVRYEAIDTALGLLADRAVELGGALRVPHGTHGARHAPSPHRPKTQVAPPPLSASLERGDPHRGPSSGRPRARTEHRGHRTGLSKHPLGASVHMPRIGCGLAGGKWSRVEPLIADRLVRRGISVTVYDHGD